MPKALCLISLVASILIVVLFLADAAMGMLGMEQIAPLRAANLTMDIAFVDHGRRDDLHELVDLPRATLRRNRPSPKLAPPALAPPPPGYPIHGAVRSHGFLRPSSDHGNVTMQLSRRQFHRLAGSAAALGASQSFAPRSWAAETGPLETFVPTRAITRGPRNHWFGYYDKREFDPTNRYVLCQRNEL